MRRRSLLGTFAACAVGSGLAGCVDATADSTPTGTPSPAPSTLRIRVENESETARDVTFRLTVETPGVDRYEFFSLSGVEPGTTVRAEPRSLQAGSYELRVELPQGGTTIRWTGRECAEKLVVLRFPPDGSVVISDRCPSAE